MLMQDDMPVVSLRDTDVYQENRLIIKHLNFDIHRGEFVYLIGKTGSGKTSLLKTIYADLEVQQGEVNVVGFQVHQIKSKEVPYLRRKLGIIFQDFELFTDRSVEENLKFVLKATGWKDKSLIQERINYVLEQVGLQNTQKKFPHQLSGGEQQRVAIARALLNRPEIILADEPTGNLDPTVGKEILHLFAEINRKGTAVLMATHQHNFIKEFPSRVIYCENGSIKDINKKRIIEKIQ
ncbi:ATP-binding cassette domain-containing protein [Rapidithrix thailandica]|uniref:Cell division ATP-binding protein FtsE n=1 Tax=Rapidithrix thailandica TaxID=413964 RepID=A0AAW9S6T4_9BACT